MVGMQAAAEKQFDVHGSEDPARARALLGRMLGDFGATARFHDDGGSGSGGSGQQGGGQKYPRGRFPASAKHARVPGMRLLDSKL